MDAALFAKLAMALAPVIVLVVVFERLDVFRLVSTGAVIAYILAGAALAALGYVANGHVMDGLPIGFTDYSRYVAPVIEEVLKALPIVALFALDRVGFKLDAAIAGFALGAGFSVYENVYLMTLFPGANLGVWIVRGFGTAVMHGGATALFAVITHEFSEHQAHREGRHARLYPWLFLPGLIVAIAIHSAFNHLPGDPLLAMFLAMLLIPLTLLVVFAKGGASAHDWLEHDHEGHAAMLAELRGGRFAETEEGRAIAALTQRLAPRIADAVKSWMELQLMLVLRAEEVLLAHEHGEAGGRRRGRARTVPSTRRPRPPNRPRRAPRHPAASAFQPQRPLRIAHAAPSRRQRARAPRLKRTCRSGPDEHVLEVAAVEAILGVFREALEGGFEALDRVLGAFGVWEVGGEQEELLAALADDGAGVLGGEGREAHRAADELRRRHAEARDHRVGLAPALPGAVEAAQEVRNPAGAQFDDAATQSRESVEDAVQGQRTEEVLRREAEREVILGP